MQVFYFRDDPATGDVKCEVVLAATESEAWQIVISGMDEGYVEEHVELLDCHPVKPGKLVSYSDSEDGIEVEMPQAGLSLP